MLLVVVFLLRCRRRRHHTGAKKGDIKCRRLICVLFASFPFAEHSHKWINVLKDHKRKQEKRQKALHLLP